MKVLKQTIITIGYLLIANTLFAYTRQDTLRGSNNTGRSWWDVQEYNLNIRIDTATRSITGFNEIVFNVKENSRDSMQIDLQEPLLIDSVTFRGKENQPVKLSFVKEGKVWWLTGPFTQWSKGTTQAIRVYYHGTPREAKLPPWDGGFIWTKDSTGKLWLSVACQGLGASSWWPCKDYQGDEPDNGMSMNISLPYGLRLVSNGTTHDNSNWSEWPEGRMMPPPGQTEYETWSWKVKNPINTYNATFYAGDYVRWTDTIMGENGKLDLSFYCLRYNEVKARKQFAVVKEMLHCYEYWMGPYPFYVDGYKVVEAPHLGMEHQSAIAYGNEYKSGYRGKDRSNTGIGNLFDALLIHESGHEWFGNNITAADIADNWIHEGFTTYTEALFAEWITDREKAFRYTRGEWFNIRNDIPVIGDYGVQDGGSSDKYDKGSAIVHMIRVMMNDDKKFRLMLRDMNKTYYHKLVTSADIEMFIMNYTGLELRGFFDQYLRTKETPELEWYIKKDKLYYRFTNTVDNFTLPLQITDDEKTEIIRPNRDWQSINWKNGGYNVSISKDYLVKLEP